MRPTPLDPTRPYKPLDVGNGVVAGTVTAAGRWLSLGIAHPVHGRMVLAAPPWFDESRRRDQAAVRRHRAALADRGRGGFGLALLERAAAEAFLVEEAMPLAVIDRPEARIEVTTFAPADRSGVTQIVRIAARGAAFTADPRWTGTYRLQRADYTELTEGGPLPPLQPGGRRGAEGGLVWTADPEIGTAAVRLPGPVVVEAGASRAVIVAVALGPEHDAALAEAEALWREAAGLLKAEVAARRSYWMRLAPTAAGADAPGDADASPGSLTRGSALRRGLAYVVDQAACRSGGAVAMLADHELLPLVWTRDAYYSARLLLSVASVDERALATVDGCLRWLFEVAERPGGWWPRASLASGKAKDRAFQMDQQLYPVLLLADRERLAGADPRLERHRAAAGRVCDALLERRTAFGLIATEETPGDDPLRQPFHFSSHVLLWRVLRALGREDDGDSVAAAVWEHFVDEGRFAYCIAGTGSSGRWHHHDANDLPTAFAPGWGFCSAEDERWRATIDYAWSERNEAYRPGPFGGLGSLHTPHPWPLGDLQRLVIARATGDAPLAAAAERRLSEVSTWDGLLPEAYDELTGAVASRHWFAWPVALRALLAGDATLTAP